MSGKKTPKGKNLIVNPLRSIRHADGFHQRVVEAYKPRDPSKFTKLDDLCMSCWNELNDCDCPEETLDDGC